MLLSGKGLKHDFVRFVSATVASQVVFSLYSMVDGLMVSLGVNEYAMSAVNLAIPFTNALFSIAVLFAVGSSTLIAIAIAQDKRREANTLFSQNFATLLILGAVATALVLLFLEPFARLLGADEITLDYVKHYLLGLAPFSVCYLVSYNLEVLVKTDGFPRYALFTVIAGCLTNCVLDYIAIFWLDMGVFGAAVATGISQLVTCLSYFAHFFSKKCTFRLCKFRFDPHLYARILPIGLADGVTELCNGVMIFLFNRVILRCLGDDALVSYTIIAYVNTLIVNTMLGISQGSQPLVSYHYGKEDAAGYRKLLRYGATAVAIMTAVIFAGVMLFAPQIAGIFVDAEKPWLAADTAGALRRYGLCYLLLGGNILMGGFLTAVEQPKAAISISVGRGLAFQAGALFLLAFAVGGTAIWYAPLVSEALCAVMAVLFMRKFLNKTKAA